MANNEAAPGAGTFTAAASATALDPDASDGPFVDFFVRFPTSPDSHPPADEELELNWVQLLHIPADRCKEFALTAAMWLRWVGYCLVGVEGRLRTSDDLEDASNIINDHDLNVVLGPRVYYEQEGPFEPSRFFPVDHFFDDKSESSHSSLSTSESFEEFRKRVRERDNDQDVSGISSIYDACHVIHRRKGDSYIKMLTERRGSTMDDVIDDIDDTKNGILFNPMLHRYLDMSGCAIIEVPNPVMSSLADVAICNGPVQSVLGSPLQDQRRYILHCFGFEGKLERCFPNGMRLNSSGPSNKPWVPSVLLAFRYGCVVLKQFASANVLQEPEKFKSWNYPKDYEELKVAAKQSRLERRIRDRASRRERPQEFDVYDIMLQIACMTASISAPGPAPAPQLSTEDEFEQTGKRDQIEFWRRSVDSPLEENTESQEGQCTNPSLPSDSDDPGQEVQ